MEARVRKLATGVHDTRAEMARVQLELNLQIAELQLKAQPSTSPEVREQRITAVTTMIVEIDSEVAHCMQLFEQSFEVLATLQEDPTIEHLEKEAGEIQHKYDKVKWTA